MDKLFNSTYNKVNMDEKFKSELRNRLDNMETGGKPKLYRISLAGKVAAAAAFTLAMLMCIPATRGGIISAAEYVRNVFYSSKGDELVVENGRDAESEWTSVTVTENEDKDYYVVEDGRIYFVLDDIKEDITDQCGEDKWFRYKNKKEDGGWSIILIGGTPDNIGWAELLFDKNGTYYNNIMDVPMNSHWLDPAMDAEGVPTGNPEYDQEFLQE